MKSFHRMGHNTKRLKSGKHLCRCRTRYSPFATADENRVFLWKKGQSPESYSIYRTSDDTNKRSMEDIPSEEIINAVKEVLCQQISLSEIRPRKRNSQEIRLHKSRRHNGERNKLHPEKSSHRRSYQKIRKRKHLRKIIHKPKPPPRAFLPAVVSIHISISISPSKAASQPCACRYR